MAISIFSKYIREIIVERDGFGAICIDGRLPISVGLGLCFSRCSLWLVVRLLNVELPARIGALGIFIQETDQLQRTEAAKEIPSAVLRHSLVDPECREFGRMLSHGCHVGLRGRV